MAGKLCFPQAPQVSFAQRHLETAGLELVELAITVGPHPPPHHVSWPLCFSGKTRTKDKYRVVYTDHQRLELEKEFHYSRYITIRRKSELAANLGLTERQVKIWFQNRRAKERKVNKKKQQQQQQPPPPAHEVAPTAAGPSLGGLGPSSASLLGASSPMPVKEEYLP
ncbi:homeobox protein CDX-1 [Panthera uncia]|uniref:homeobox protein CDX-1 n=1 Tax=Panthera uncia TaxID=29064 RepID=UPI0020FFF0F1|nr:homeobox protein CDX-1 [Panthera uncia]